jgi:large subunit ribosomal protein L6
MKKEIIQEVKIPSEVSVEINNAIVSIKADGKENLREFKLGKIELEKKDNLIKIKCKNSTKTEKKKINTITAHIKNMIQGVLEGFFYDLKICFVHFPMTVEIKGNEAIIKNFLGEKTPRTCKIPEGVNVELNKDIIKVTSHNKELAGQAAANFEKATRIRLRDRRIFQDGIFITNKNGKEM